MGCHFLLWGSSQSRDWTLIFSLASIFYHQVTREAQILFSLSCCSVTQSRLTLCDPMDWSMPGFSVLHHLLEPAQTHVHWVGDAIQPSHLLSSPSLPALSFLLSGSFLMSQLYASGGQSIGASASVLPMNIQDWFPLGLTGWISLRSKGLSRVFSNTIVQKCSVFFMVQLSLTSIHDYWKNRRLDGPLLAK